MVDEMAAKVGKVDWAGSEEMEGEKVAMGAVVEAGLAAKAMGLEVPAG